MLQEPL